MATINSVLQGGVDGVMQGDAVMALAPVALAGDRCDVGIEIALGGRLALDAADALARGGDVDALGRCVVVVDAAASVLADVEGSWTNGGTFFSDGGVR